MVLVAYWWPSDSTDESNQNVAEKKSNAIETVRQAATEHNPFAVSEKLSANADAVQASADSIPSTTTPLTDQPVQYSNECGDACREILDRIDFPFSLSDEEFEDGLAHTEALAQHLKLNPHLTDSWIELASFANGNKRSLILATFSQLDAEHQQSLGLALLDSPSYAHRMDAVRLLSSEAVMTNNQIDLFAQRLLSEPDNYVRSALVKALNQPNSALEKAALIASLEPIIHNDSDYAVRGEALLATVDLHEHPQLALDQALAAVHSDIGEFQEYGARALEAIVVRQSLEGIVLNSAQQQALSELKDNLMEPQFDELPVDARRLIDNL